MSHYFILVVTKNELRDILKKLSNSLRDLSINVALLEEYVVKQEEFNNESGEENAEESVIETPGLVKSRKTIEILKKKNSSEEKSDLPSEALVPNYKIISVQDIKKKFELKRQKHFEKRSSESSEIFEILGTPEGNNTTKIEKLKKKFESFDSDVSDLSEQINNKKVTKEVEMQNFSNDYRDKIQKVLKYFKAPQ